jgi:hypothetical protein
MTIFDTLPKRVVADRRNIWRRPAREIDSRDLGSHAAAADCERAGDQDDVA